LSKAVPRFSCGWIRTAPRTTSISRTSSKQASTLSPLALKAVVEAAAYDAGDFFEFEVARDNAIEVDTDHPLERSISVPVTARIGGAVFAEFSVDLALPRDDRIDVEWLKPEATLTGDPAVDEIPAVAVLALPAQVADKTCAIYELHGPERHPSSRARDLADIAMIAAQKDFDGDELTSQVRREERRRLGVGTLIEPLPAALRLSPAQRADWGSRWHKATRNAPIEFDDAQAIAARFMDPVLTGAATGKSWRAARQQWE
jgi:hypothetical protein